MRILRIIGYLLLGLGVLAAVTLFLLPFGFLQRAGWFKENPETTLWCLFILGPAFALLFLTLASQQRRRRNLLQRVGSILLVFGLANAAEIFWISAYRPDVTDTNSLWWLFVLCTAAGGAGVYAADRAAARELKAEDERIKRMEMEAEALERKEPKIVSLRIVSFEVRPQSARCRNVRLKRSVVAELN